MAVKTLLANKLLKVLYKIQKKNIKNKRPVAEKQTAATPIQQT